MLMRRSLFAGLMSLLLPGHLLAQAPASPQAPGGGAADGRLDVFWRTAVLSPAPYALDVAGAVVNEMARFPEEWTGRKGFGQRMLARAGSGLLSSAVDHGVAAVLKHRVQYEPCTCSGGWMRTRHAFGRGFTTRTDAGGLAPHLSLFVAKAATARMQASWYPESYRARDMTRSAVLGVGVSAGLNIVREFAPELKRLVRIR